MVAGRFEQLLIAMTDADGYADLSLSFDSQAAVVGIGRTMGAVGTACAVRIVDGARRKRRAVPPIGVAG